MLAGLQVESGQTDAAVRPLDRASEEVDPAQAGSIRRQLEKLERSGAKVTSVKWRGLLPSHSFSFDSM